MADVLSKIAFYQNRRDDEPNKQLARQLAAAQDRQGIAEIAENLWHENSNVSSDCIKVLYEIGYLAPALITDYVGDFVKLLRSRENRMVWGGMIALSTIAPLKADQLFPHLEDIQAAIKKGSVITVDAGVRTLAGIAAQRNEYRKVILPYLMRLLDTCRPKSVPQYAESTALAVNADYAADFVTVLEKRMQDISASQAARLRKVIESAAKLL